MNRLIGGALVILLGWGAIKSGLVDLVVTSLVSDLAAEMYRLSGPLTVLLVALAVPVALIGLGLAISRQHRSLGIELMVLAVVVVFGSQLIPIAGRWAQMESGVLSAQLTRATTVAPGGHS